MAAQDYWQGYLKLSLVTCAVTMTPATTDGEKLKFHTLNRQTGHRVVSRYVDAVTGKVDKEDDLAAEFVVRPRLVLGDAVDLGFMQRIYLVAALGLLVQQVRDAGELGDDPVAQGSCGDIVEVTAQVANDPAGVTFKRLQCLAHPPKLFGMSMAAHSHRQPRGQTGIGLAQLHPGLLRKGHQLRPRPYVKQGVCCGQVLAGQAIFADDTPVAMLAPGTGKTQTARLWAYGRDERPWGSTVPPASLAIVLGPMADNGSISVLMRPQRPAPKGPSVQVYRLDARRRLCRVRRPVSFRRDP